MTAVTKFFFTPVLETPSAFAVINWWESRRMVYNIAVGAVGLLSLTAMAFFALLPPRAENITFLWPVVLVYGVLANLCYSLGPFADLFIRRVWGERYGVIGPVLLRYGFAFSIGLSLLPIPFAALGWAVRVVRLFV
jgi:hypothetical protein